MGDVIPGCAVPPDAGFGRWTNPSAGSQEWAFTEIP